MRISDWSSDVCSSDLVRKTPDEWFFLAYDMTQTVRGEERFNRALYGSVIVFTLLSPFVGWWAASRVMSPVSELARRLQASGDSTRPEPPATQFPADEVGQLPSPLHAYPTSLPAVVQRQDRQ